MLLERTGSSAQPQLTGTNNFQMSARQVASRAARQAVRKGRTRRGVKRWAQRLDALRARLTGRCP